MSTPKISIVFPVYNVEYYLEEALDSLVNQTFINNIEVLMIDDGSTDKSRYIIEKYALNYDNFYAFHKKNEGLGSARNFGLHLAKGEYIHFMDSDDYILYDSYEKLYKFAKKYDCDVVTSNYLKYNTEFSWTAHIGEYVFKDSIKNIKNTSLYAHTELSWDMLVWNKLIRKEFLKKNNIKFYHKKIIYEDNLFTIELYSKTNKVGILKDYTYCWRMRDVGTSITQLQDLSKGEKLYEMAILVNDYLKQNINNKEVLKEKYLKFLTNDLFYFVNSIKYFPKKNHYYLIEQAYNLTELVPEYIFENLNSYFKAMYKNVKSKNLKEIMLLITTDFKKNPQNLKSISEKNLINDSKYEKLESTTNNIYFENNNMIIEFENYVPYNPKNNFKEMEFILKNNNDAINLHPKYENKLYVPLNILQTGETKIMVKFEYENIKKENYMKTKLSKIYNYKDYEIFILPDKTTCLRIIKREKNDIDLTLDNITLEDNKLQIVGTSNDKINTIFINDYFDFSKFIYSIKWNENKFFIDIPYEDFLKSPIKKWIMSSNEQFNKINVTQEYQFFNEKYLINIENFDNKIIIEFKLYDPIEKIKKLIQENNQINEFNNKLIKINNELNTEKNKSHLEQYEVQYYFPIIKNNENTLLNKHLHTNHIIRFKYKKLKTDNCRGYIQIGNNWNNSIFIGQISTTHFGILLKKNGQKINKKFLGNLPLENYLEIEYEHNNGVHTLKLEGVIIISYENKEINYTKLYQVFKDINCSITDLRVFNEIIIN